MSRSERSRMSYAPRLLAGLILLLVGVWLGGHPSWLPSGLRTVFVEDNQGRLVNEVLSDLAHDYYKSVNKTQLANGGVSSMISSLHDPYSYYLDPSSYRNFLRQSNPHINGIGINVVQDPKGLKIVGVYPRTPAATAGLQPDDVIVQVGSTTLAGRTEDFSSGLVKGTPGTRVGLVVVRNGVRKAFSVVRAALVIPVAVGRTVAVGATKLGDVRLSAFDDGAGKEVRDQVDKQLKAGAKGIILDLRRNGGGLLDEAVNVSSVFIPDGTIVSTAGRSQPRQVYTAKGGAIPSSIPVVVLVDHDTASAAEIVSGALQDRGRGKVVGTHTYGKGVFQEIRELSNGGALHITIGEYFTPSGRNLGGGGVKQGAGVQPNVTVTLGRHPRGDPALSVAEHTLAAEIR